MENCQFLRCTCDAESQLGQKFDLVWGMINEEPERYHYLINDIDATPQQNQNTFTQCKTASKPTGTAEWGIKI